MVWITITKFALSNLIFAVWNAGRAGRYIEAVFIKNTDLATQGIDASYGFQYGENRTAMDSEYPPSITVI